MEISDFNGAESQAVDDVALKRGGFRMVLFFNLVAVLFDKVLDGFF